MDRKSRRCLNKRVNDAMDLIEEAGASGSIYEEELYKENIGNISIISSNSDNDASANSNILINDITPALEEYSSSISSTPHNETCTDKSFSDMDLSDEGINLPTQAVLSDFTTKLASWAIQDNISMESLGRLLVLLKSEPALSYLPKDARSLLKTPRNQNNDIKHIQPGKFFYFGIESQVCLLFVKHALFPEKTLDIKLHINIDGLPLAKSTGSAFWPILGNIKSINKVENDIFIIGLYHGLHKPINSNDFLEDFVNEVTTLINEGIYINQIKHNFTLNAVICDLPARSFVLQTKGHSGYSSCTKCTLEGDYIGSNMCFPDIEFIKRTDCSFRTQEHQEHHLGETILLKIPKFDMITNVPLDSMHLVFLGITKRLLTHKKFGFVYGKPPHKLPVRGINTISFRLEKMKVNIPVEFARKTRTLLESRRYKATELRLFLLYVAPVVLRQVIGRDYYDNIMTLHLAIRILSSAHDFNDKNREYAHNLIKHFIWTSENLYGAEFITHCVHGLLHLAEDTKVFGVLENYSAFPFENLMKSVKSMVRKPEKPLEQAIKRIKEKSMITKVEHDNTEKLYSREHFKGPALENHKQYYTLKLPTYTIKLNLADSTVLLKNKKVVKVLNIIVSKNDVVLIVTKRYNKKGNLYNKPCDSSLYNIYKCTSLSENIKYYNMAEIEMKLVSLPIEEGAFAVFPLLHCQG